MVTPDLVAYIWSERKKGVADHIIKAYLATQGWSEADFKEAVAALPPPHTTIDPKMSGDLLRQLSENVVWRTPDGKSDLPAKPIVKKHPWILKVGIYIVAAGLLAAAIYIYRDAIIAKLTECYEIALPMLAKIAYVVIKATDFLDR